MWLAGGGVKGGHVHGATDEFGFDAVEDRVHVHDLHATILHLLGLDHEKLTYRYSGRDFRLTDVHGQVVTRDPGVNPRDDTPAIGGPGPRGSIPPPGTPRHGAPHAPCLRNSSSSCAQRGASPCTRSGCCSARSRISARSVARS